MATSGQARQPESKPGSARRVAVPSAAYDLSTLPRVDYADAFAASTEGAAERTAGEWARTALEGLPPAVQRSLRLGWTVLGLKMEPAGAARSVLGWRIRHQEPERALLGADSRLGLPAEILFERRRGELLIATLVGQRNPPRARSGRRWPRATATSSPACWRAR